MWLYTFLLSTFFVSLCVYRYHRTLKDVGLTSRMSPGNVIEKILKVNRVQLRKSRHADFEQLIKVQKHLPDCLRGFAHTVSPYVLRRMVEEHDKSVKGTFAMEEVLTPVMN